MSAEDSLGARHGIAPQSKSFIQHEVQSGSIVVKPVRGKDNPADIFTKSLDGPTTLRHMASLGLEEVQLRKGSACAVRLLKGVVSKGE